MCARFHTAISHYHLELHQNLNGPTLLLRRFIAPLYLQHLQIKRISLSTRALYHCLPFMTVSASPSAISEDAQPTPHVFKPKLFGRAFYESIGSPKYIVAPMVDQSELAWRLLSRDHMPKGSTLCYTPMFHSRNFAASPTYRQQTFPAPTSLDGNLEHDRPLFVQFCSNTPTDLLGAAKFVAPYCDAVDLNLGCPQGIAKKGHYGAFLQEDWKLIYDLITTLHRELPIPVTAKIRILDTKERTLEYAKMILSAGVSILTVHGRTREQKGHNTGLADWSVLKYLRDNLPPETVLFANGNVMWSEDVERCLKETGVDGVMSAEGNLCNPAGIFRSPTAENTWDEIYPRMDIICKQYLDTIRDKILPYIAPGEHGRLDPNLVAIKAHFFKLLHCLLPRHTDIRAMLARSRAYAVGNSQGKQPLEDFEMVLAEVEKAVKGELAREPEPIDPVTGEWVGPDMLVSHEVGSSDGAILPCGTKRRVVPYYRCQPYYRPLPEEAIKKGALTLKESKKEKQEKRGSAAKRCADDNVQTGSGNVENNSDVKRQKLDNCGVEQIANDASMLPDVDIIEKEERRKVMDGIEVSRQ